MAKNIGTGALRGHVKGFLALAFLALGLGFSTAPLNAKPNKAEREAAAAAAENAARVVAGKTADAAPVGTSVNPAANAPAGALGGGAKATDNAAIGKPRVLSLTFKQLGALAPIGLRGVDGSSSLPFSIRADEVVVSAKIKIDYNYSPSLIPELSHLKVMLNDEVIAVVPLPRDKILNNVREIELDPRLFTDFNKLRFGLIGHYTYKCEDPMHSSLWLNLSHRGHIELSLAPLLLADDLKYLPAPFFDRRESGPLKLPFVFAATPSFGTLKTAGILASWFAGLASYRGAQFPVSLNSLPEGNAVVIIQGGDKVAGLDASGAATVTMIAHPNNPNAKLLVVSGRNNEELMWAANAIVLNANTFTGPRVTLTKNSEPPPRKPYDAPLWVPIDHPVPFGELAKMDELQVKGYFPDVVRVNFRVSPDLFTWRSPGVPLELKYRFTKLPFNKNSSLNVSVNGNFVQALSLHEPGKKAVPIEKLKLPVLDTNLALREDMLYVPPYQVGGRNQLQLHYYFDVVKEGECRDSLPDNLQAAIDPESTLDFSGFSHYAALPNLAYFANIGFPFTRMADLSETAVVMPDRPDVHELASYLAMMGRMGESTGYPVLRHQVISAADVDKFADKDLLVIGSAQSQGLMSRWAEYLPLVQANGERRLREPDVFRRAVYRWEEKDVQLAQRPNGTLNFKGAGDLTSMMAFESPLKAKRSVVFMYADKSADLHKITDTLNTSERIAGIQGDFVVFNEKTANHAMIGDTYYVGSLPLLHHLRWFFSMHPIVVGMFGILISILLAAMIYRILRRVAAKRLNKKKAS